MDAKFSPEFIDELVEFLNQKIDIPLLSEAAEESLFKGLLSALFQLLGAKEK